MGERRVRCAELDEAWARTAPAAVARAAILGGFIEPQLKYFLRREVTGAERLAQLRGPVVFVANHSSHIDTPIILNALPRVWRRRTVVAAAADYFYRARRKAIAVSLAFNTVPVMREGGGSGQMEHVDRLLDSGWSMLVYPEGTRAKEGHEERLRTGAAVIAAQHGIPLVPIHVTGTRDAMPRGKAWPWRSPRRPRFAVRVAFGEPIRPVATDERRQALARVQAFFDAEDAAERVPVGAAGD